MKRTRAYRGRVIQGRGVETSREIALDLVLMMLARRKSRFPLPFRTLPEQVSNEITGSPQGFLVVGPHTILLMTALRLLHELGRKPVVVASMSSVPIYGTELEAEIIQPSPLFLITVRNRLRSGDVICALIDRGGTGERSTVEFQTVGGSMRVANALLDVALRTGVRIYFAAARFKDGLIVMTFESPDPDSPQSLDVRTEQFIAFLQRHAEEVAKDSGHRPLATLR